jgi:hypothetical protein
MEKLRSLFASRIDSSQLIIAIVSAGIVLRVSGLTTSAIWYDESLPFEAAKLPFFSMLEATKFTFSPPLWGIIVWVSVRLLGQNELALRLPSLLAGIFTLWMVYKLAGGFNLSKNQTVIVLLFASFLPYQFSMAQDGRMYTIILGLYLCATWFALHHRWLGLTACAGLLLYTHYTAPFYLAGIYTVAIINNGFDLKQFKRTVISGMIAVLCFLPWVPIYISTTKIESPILPLSLEGLIIMFYRIAFNDTLKNAPFIVSLALLTIILTMVLSFVFCIMLLLVNHNNLQLATRPNDQPEQAQALRYLQLMIFALLPLAAMLVWNFTWKSFLYYRLLAATVVPIILWTVYSFSKISRPLFINNVLLTIWVILLCVSMINWSPSNKGGDVHSVVNLIDTQWQKGDIIYHITGTSYLPFSQYLGNKSEYLFDEQQHSWLLHPQLQDLFHIKRSPLESLSYQRVWVVYSRDDLLTQDANKRAQAYIQNGTLVGIVTAWYFAPIEIYLVLKSAHR